MQGARAIHPQEEGGAPMGVDAGQGRNQSGKKSKFSSASFSQRNKRSSVASTERPSTSPEAPARNLSEQRSSLLSPATNILHN